MTLTLEEFARRFLEIVTPAYPEDARLPTLRADVREALGLPRNGALKLPPWWDGETCQNCARPYELVWWADPEMWEAVTGRTDGGGLYCPDCFTRMASEKGLNLRWMPEVLDTVAESLEDREAVWLGDGRSDTSESSSTEGQR